jgi:ribosomal RNA-processing protein 36
LQGSDIGNHIVEQQSLISFGALAKAQNGLLQSSNQDRKRKRGTEASESQKSKLQALRTRLQELKAAKLSSQRQDPGMEKFRTETDSDGTEYSSDSDESVSSTSAQRQKSRSSKHAPASQPSNRPVSWNRTVIASERAKPRDPRFGPLPGAPQEDQRILTKKYSFLADYRASEMAELRKAIQQTKNEGDKDKLKRKLMSMESQDKAAKAKEQEQEIIREHRRKEKQAIKEGKKPFYLKKCKFSYGYPNCQLLG